MLLPLLGSLNVMFTYFLLYKFLKTVKYEMPKPANDKNTIPKSILISMNFVLMIFDNRKYSNKNKKQDRIINDPLNFIRLS